MTSLEKLLAEVKELDTTATPGPRWVSSSGHVVYTTALQDTGPICVLDDGEYIENPNKEADARFIARARSLLPKLAEIVEQFKTTFRLIEYDENYADPNTCDSPAARVQEALNRAEEIASEEEKTDE